MRVQPFTSPVISRSTLTPPSVQFGEVTGSQVRGVDHGSTITFTRNGKSVTLAVNRAYDISSSDGHWTREPFDVHHPFATRPATWVPGTTQTCVEIEGRDNGQPKTQYYISEGSEGGFVLEAGTRTYPITAIQNPTEAAQNTRPQYGLSPSR